MCRWIGSHFHGWIDYNGGCIFIRVTQNGIAHFRKLGDQKIQVRRDLKMGRILLH